MKTYFQVRKNVYKDICPDVEMTFYFLNKNDGTIVRVSDDHTPLNKYQRDPQYQKLYEEAHIKVKLYIFISPLSYITRPNFFRSCFFFSSKLAIKE